MCVPMPFRGLRWAWRQDPGGVLRACAALAVALPVYTATLGAEINAEQPAGQPLVWMVLELFMLHRCYRGGSIAWTLLVILHGLPLLAITFGMAGWPGWYAVGLLVQIVVPLVLLLSPAVRRRVFGDRRPVRLGTA